MIFLTEKECVEWCKKHSIEVDESSKPIIPPNQHSLSFYKPVISSVQLSLSRYLIECLGDFGSILFWIMDWPLYKADEMAMILSLRKGYNETRDLIDAPGYVVDKEEIDKLVGYVFLMIAYEWDSFFVTNHSRTMIFISHDGYIVIYNNDKQKIEELREIITDYKLDIM